MSSMFHVPDYKSNYCQQQATFNNVLTEPPRPQEDLAEFLVPVQNLQPRPQDASETGEAQ